MKILGIVSNSLLLILGLMFIVNSYNNTYDRIIALTMVITALINLYFVLRQNGNDLITLYLKRRAAEEKSELNKILSE
ncbi:MAG: hypothetical protein JRJ44_08355 [Deltaproteobacteria bacterium]|nr:hypothetical protein [Deltaproteobacteria bacterium]